MTNSEIQSLIEANDSEKLTFILNNFIEKAKGLEKEANFLGIGMLLLILLYYLGDLQTPGDIQIGIITITDLSALLFLVPLIFSFLILRYVIISSHQAEVRKIIKVLTKEYFNYDNSNINPIFTDDLTRLLLPVSILDEINKINLKRKVGCISLLFLLPIGILIPMPFVLIGSWLYPQIKDFSQLDFFQKAVSALTCYIILLTLYYFIKNLFIGAIEGKEDS